MTSYLISDLASYLWLAKKTSQKELIENLIKIASDEQKKKQETIYAFKGNLLEQYDILKGEKLKKLEKKEKEEEKQAAKNEKNPKKEEKKPKKSNNKKNNKNNKRKKKSDVK